MTTGIIKEKTFADLLQDTENTWEYETSLEEDIFETEQILESTFTSKHNYMKGDIIMTSSGVSNQANFPITSPHRIYVIEGMSGEPGNRQLRGYLLSSNVRKANYLNEYYPNNIYISDYATILAKGAGPNKDAFINLIDLYTINEADLASASGTWKGRANAEFIRFIDKAVQRIANGESNANTFWIR